MGTKLDQSQIAYLKKHSVKNMHVKGFSYLCFVRSPERTEKYYFFDREILVDKVLDLVSPHNHRYNFRTTVIRGEMSESKYALHPFGQDYLLNDWNTPLKGGDGFTPSGVVKLLEVNRTSYIQNDEYFTQAQELHTIRIHRPGTILKLVQFNSLLGPNDPTQVYTPIGSKIPEHWSKTGLYEQFTDDEIIKLVETLNL